SRFAETVRLLYLLRQRFSDDDWIDGPRLISDIKILLRRRRFPDWNVDVSEVIDGIPNLTSLQKDAILILTKGDFLARFQSDAIHQISTSLQKNTDSAIVIGAGTGAGKTRAFYVPALSHIVQTKTNTTAVQAIALYPRVELLKDQFREIFQEARKLDILLRGKQKNTIRIGAYYGAVPRTAKDFSQRNMGKLNWRRTRNDNGWVCPYLVCPYCGNGRLAWSDEHIDLEARNTNLTAIGNHEILECLSCKSTTNGSILPLTRKHLLHHPPDILVTTTETLNRRMSDPGERHLFGIDVPAPPRLLLMDEIHLNEGFHGAQVAYLLRRWRYARGDKHGLCIVGLSATLAQAELFFSRLTGISNVSYITPSADDLIDEGLEYNLVVKGDMVSGATLLSTSVRTVMLLGRTLDPLHTQPVSRGAWGQRVFAFSDKLDSINRWYHILKEVENPVQPYAQWRFVDPVKNREAWVSRNDVGQNWWVATQIEPNALKNGLLLDITSSQNRGVNPKANIVIASSTLEVGYNDPKVGAIIQHKAPYSHASFLQRKGRAGRPRSMRPWTIVITSSYGRDRWAFQHAESLFEPLIPPIELPIENYYVRKVQAVFALMDWLASELNTMGNSTPLWTLLGSETPHQQSEQHKTARSILCKILEQVVQNATVRSNMRKYIWSALDISEEYILQMLLWGEPRSIMLDVIPSMLRRLRTNWQKMDFNEAWETSKWRDNISSYPLPEYIPASLFSDLNVPEVVITVPEKPRFKDEERRIRSQEALGLTLGMMEFTPGKVNKRFANKDRITESHWIPVPDTDLTQIDINELDMTFGNLPYRILDKGQPILIYRPNIFNLQAVPKYIRPSSNAYHNWKSHILSQSLQHTLSVEENFLKPTGTEIKLDKSSLWHTMFPKIIAYTHTQGTWAEMTRYTTSTDVYTRYDSGFEDRKTISYIANNSEAAMGFRIDVDALYFKVSPLDFEQLIQKKHWPSLYQRLKPRFFRHKLSLTLPDKNRFELDWIWEVELSMIIERATTLGISLQEAVEIVHDYQYRHELVAQNLHLIFNNSTLDDEVDRPEEKNYLTDKIYGLLLD
ncbi:MAG: DEAD/DEAH box helicase, partial [Calditrichaeota bacterium]|nr:DEAD/DEAH box helicase [Calditrichota bacterium]